MSTTPQQPAPADNALFIVIGSLSVGIGIPFARMAAPHILPDLDHTWGVITVNALSAGVVCGIVALVLCGVAKLFCKRTPTASGDKSHQQVEQSR